MENRFFIIIQSILLDFQTTFSVFAVFVLPGFRGTQEGFIFLAWDNTEKKSIHYREL